MSVRTLPEGGPFSLIMDGREVIAEPGSTLLQVARAAGLPIPTLCDHPDLEPVGACRLCMVQVTHPDWGGWKGLMTACNYPSAPGLQVSTTAKEVQEVRRGVLSLLAARCPSSSVIQELARRHGADAGALLVDPEADDCILCGLCTRVCEAFATCAISTTHRGIRRKVNAPMDLPPADCVGCGACARICPTGHIEDGREQGMYRVWGREFPIAACAVIVGRCVGCGACEEACPFDVPRVTLQRDGLRTARIPPAPCRGCGACVGACPNGAIMQQGDPLPMPGQGPAEQSAAGRATVVACSRSALGDGAAPRGVDVVELACAGRVTVNQILRRLALGADGVLVLGRHEQTCRLEGGEEPARERVTRAAALLELVGLGGARVRFASPGAGADGPRREVERFVGALKSLGPNPAASEASLPPWTGEDLQGGLTLVRWLAARAHSAPDPGRYLEGLGLRAWQQGDPGWKLWAGDIPYLQLLGGTLWAPGGLPRLLVDAARALEALLGEPGGVLMEPDGAAPEGAYTLDGLDALLRERGAGLPRPARARTVACQGAEAEALAAALGHRPVRVQPSPVASAPMAGPAARKAAGAFLATVAQKGAEALLVSGMEELVRWRMITRDGAWRSSAVQPLAGVQLAGEVLP